MADLIVDSLLDPVVLLVDNDWGGPDSPCFGDGFTPFNIGRALFLTGTLGWSLLDLSSMIGGQASEY